MLDPFYGILFYSKNNMMASLSDISSGNINAPTNSTLPENYLMTSIQKKYLGPTKQKKYTKV